MSNFRTELIGLILAGGKSSRMGTDKAFMLYNGKPVYRHMYKMLSPFCCSVIISCRKEQKPLFHPHAAVEDMDEDIGPLAGLLAAWTKYPGRPLLVIAVDMPEVDRNLLARLVTTRNPKKLVTGFTGKNNIYVEPLCTIYEASFQEVIRTHAAENNHSLSRLIQQLPDKETIKLPDLKALRSFNLPEDWV